MKSGMKLSVFAAEVERQAGAKRDFRVPTTKVLMVPDGDGVAAELLGSDEALHFPATRHFNQQLADSLGISWTYYERCMKQSRELLCTNTNYWLSHNEPDVRMVRTLDGNARAYLGSTYRPLDNYDLLRAVAPHLMGPKAEGIRIQSVMVTDTRFYIKAFTDRIQGEVRKGDLIQSGITISNSEVGLGSISVEPAALRLACLNGATFNDAALKRRHVGGRSDADGLEEYLSDKTKAVMDEAFWRQVCDVVDGAFDEVIFARQLDKMRAACDNRIAAGGASLPEITEVVRKDYNLTKGEGDILLHNLITGGDLSQYGLMNAATLLAQHETVSYDRASELERVGGRILEMPQARWHEIAG